MSHIRELHNYIERLHGRLRLGAWLQGAALFTGTALAVTVALVLLLNQFAFPTRGVTVARLIIVVALGAAAAFGLALPLLRLTRAHAVHRAETANPELEQRLTTFQERAADSSDPFVELLAADTLKHTQEAPPASLVPRDRLLALGGAGLGCLAVLVWMIAAGPGYLGYGAALLWVGPAKNLPPLYSLTVKPGNATVRRNSDQLIFAHVSGMQPVNAHIFARFQSSRGWEPVMMQPAPDPGGGMSYRFVFAGIPENVEYYVAAGPLQSPHYTLHVVDLPSVQQVNVTYRYPAWTGLKTVSEEHSGDLRAIEGTQAQLQVRMDRPLKDGQLVLDGGQAIPLKAGENNVYTATIHMEKDGAYHVAALQDGQSVRLSEDYFIATDKAQPPQVAIDRPAGDYRASPIEEVTVGVKAADQFGLKDVHLHYSVNGGADHDVSLLDKPGEKEADGRQMIPLESLKLVPGDVISVYATARDGNSQAQTDISFIQVDPFEREFTQSQASGGGGGGGGGGSAGDQTEISKREKELIAATWKQQNEKGATAKDNTAQGQFLSDAQQKLRDQVNALSIRMQSRDIAQANQEFTDFYKDMRDAATAMGPSSDKLKATQWKEALPLEQKALQALLHAEATFRQIEVAFGQRGGGGGGGGSAGRDLASLFDLELDTEKNQYETAQSASPAEQREKNIEDALARLDALARRQEDLANQTHDPQQSFQQRWQQEMLRREAEQLQRQMEQMAQNQQGQKGAGGQQGQSQQNGQQQGQQQQGAQQSGAGGQSGSSSSAGQSQQQSASAQGGGQGSSGSQSARNGGAQGESAGQTSRQSSSQSSDRRIQDALSRLQQATDMMNRGGNAQQSEEDARAAAERLRQAQSLLQGSQQQMASGRVSSMAQEAARLSQEEREQAAQIDNLVKAGQQATASGSGGQANLDAMQQLLRQRDRLAAERQQLSDRLSQLQGNMRQSARDMGAEEPDVAKKLRDALSTMDDSELDNFVQRTADWLRRGINPNSNGTEGQIARGLGKLSDQLQQAQKAMAAAKPGAGTPGQPGAGQGDQSAALNQVERLRSELEAMARAQQGQGGQSGRDGASANGASRNNPGGQQAGNGGMLSRNGQGQSGGNGAQAGGSGGNMARGGNFGAGGDTRAGGGNGGTAWANFDTGGNTPRARGAQQAAPADASGNPADAERGFDQEMRALRQLRQTVGDNAQAAKQVDELTRQMQNLDPRRFPGNPAMVEQMHRELLGSVDRLELELQNSDAATDARTGKPYAVPAGYQEQVADYYRRLSKKQ